MTTTIEEKLEILTEGMNAIVSDLNARQGDIRSKSETKLNTNPNLGRVFTRVNLTAAIADYDFAGVEAKRGCKVAAILQVPEFAHSTDGKTPCVLMTVQMADGKTPLVKVPFLAGKKPTTAQSSPATQQIAKPIHRAPALATDSIALETVALAAMNLESRTGSTDAWRSFCASTFQKGKAACVALAQPLIASNAFPDGILPHEKVNHLRLQLVQKVMPGVLEVAGISAPAVSDAPTALPPMGTIDRWRADKNIRDEFLGNLNVYRAYCSHTYGKVTAARIRLEKSANTPRLVNGEWILGGIGTFEQQWLQSADLQKEFQSPENYAAYCRCVGA